ncbi:MAG: hypothetical protein V4697_00725 [Patescibacteria group bacterium]
MRTEHGIDSISQFPHAWVTRSEIEAGYHLIDGNRIIDMPPEQQGKNVVRVDFHGG